MHVCHLWIQDAKSESLAITSQSVVDCHYLSSQQSDDMSPRHVSELRGVVSHLRRTRRACFEAINAVVVVARDEVMNGGLFDAKQFHYLLVPTEKVTCFTEDRLEGIDDMTRTEV